MCNLVEVKSVPLVTVKASLSQASFIIPDVEMQGRLVHPAVDKHLLCNLDQVQVSLGRRKCSKLQPPLHHTMQLKVLSNPQDKESQRPLSQLRNSLLHRQDKYSSSERCYGRDTKSDTLSKHQNWQNGRSSDTCRYNYSCLLKESLTVIEAVKLICSMTINYFTYHLPSQEQHYHNEVTSRKLERSRIEEVWLK